MVVGLSIKIGHFYISWIHHILEKWPELETEELRTYYINLLRTEKNGERLNSMVNFGFHSHVPSRFFWDISDIESATEAHLVRNDVGMLISQALGHFVRGQEIACLVGQHGSAHIQHANVLNGDRAIGLGFQSSLRDLYGIFIVIYHPCFINPNPHLNFHPQHMGVSENSVPLNPMVNDHYPYHYPY